MNNKLPYTRLLKRRIILISMGILLLVAACQPAQVIITEVSATNTPAPTPSAATSTATSLPGPTSTPALLTVSTDGPRLPQEAVSDIYPAGIIPSTPGSQADIIIEMIEPGQEYASISYRVYALAAPFFTIQDDISLKELNDYLTDKSDIQDAPFAGIDARSTDKTVLQILINPDNPQSVDIIDQPFYFLNDPTEKETWSILPFENLTPAFKVISIDGVSPLDDDFDPSTYPLTLAVGLRLTDADLEVDPVLLDELLLESNYQPNWLTSLIMTGVTAMARDTAYEMEIQGVLYPGTEIRDVMRAADFTHISNEVSFYEGCKFPDPDYTGFIFCSNPEYIRLLDDLGADIIELTGNHNNDVRALYKVDSVPFTLGLYEKYGMQWYAGGINLENSRAPLKIEHNGNKLAFIGCNYYGPEMAWATEDESGAAPCEDFTWMQREIFNLKQEGYLPIVTLQYQEDYSLYATSKAIQDFRPLAEAGAIIVNGSQSHIAKGMEFYADAFVHYGLGNLFFDQPGFYITYDSFIQKHFFYMGRHISTQLLTITLEDTAKPRFMTPEEREKFLFDIFTVSEHLRRNQ